MNERDGMGKLIDVEPSFRLKKSHSYSILKALRTKKLEKSGQKFMDLNDKILVQDSERSIHVGSFERSKILIHPPEFNNSLFDTSLWTEKNLLP
jgi:hypothetical protein